MKKLFYVLAFSTLLPNAGVCQGEYINIQSQNAIGSALIDNAEKTVIDQNGNILVSGTFSEELDFDPTEETFLLSPLGLPDVFLASYAADGNFNWAFNLGRISLNNGMSVGGIAVDSQNNLVMTGSFSLNVDFDPSEENEVLSSVLGRDAFIAKYSSQGDLIWVRQFGGLGSELGTALAIDQEDNISLGLRFSSEVDLDPADENDVLINPVGGSDASIVKLDSDGNYLWSYNVSPDTDNETVSALAATPDGKVVLGAIVHATNSGIPTQSMLAAVVNPDGSESWTYDFMNLGQSNVISHIAISQNGEDFYLGGRIQEDTDFDPSSESSVIQPNFADPFISKHSLVDGSLVWATYVLSDALDDFCAGVHESNGLAFMAGSFDVQAIFDPNDFSTIEFSNGSADVFISVYDAETGAFIDAQTYGGSGAERANDAYFRGENGLCLVGNFSSSLSLLEEEIINAQGFEDGFYSRFSFLYNLSAERELQKSNVSVYPVPAIDQVFVELGQEIFGKIEIKIVNIVGQTVFEEGFVYNNARMPVDISSLPKGVYLTEIKSHNSSVTKRLIKK